MPGDRALADGNDAEASGVGERGQDAAFSDAEDRPRGALTTDMEPWIAVAGNHKGVGGIVCLHHPAQRHHDAFDVGLGLNSKWAFRKGGTHDLRTVRKSQRVQCRIETSGDGFIRIRIDNVNTPRDAFIIRLLAGGCDLAATSSRCSVALQAVGKHSPARPMIVTAPFGELAKFVRNGVRNSQYDRRYPTASHPSARGSTARYVHTRTPNDLNAPPTCQVHRGFWQDTWGVCRAVEI